MADKEPILDTIVLRVMAFAHPQGIDILLAAADAARARFPAEVYNQDEAALPLTASDEQLSELARGLRYAMRQVQSQPPDRAERYRSWLENAEQLPPHLARGSLLVDPLMVSDVPRREALLRKYARIDLGEAACLVLAERYGAEAVFLSSDEEACKAARALGLSYLALPHLLRRWVMNARPTAEELEGLITGIRAAKFGLKRDFISELRRELGLG